MFSGADLNFNDPLDLLKNLKAVDLLKDAAFKEKSTKFTRKILSFKRLNPEELELLESSLVESLQSKDGKKDHSDRLLQFATIKAIRGDIYSASQILKAVFDLVKGEESSQIILKQIAQASLICLNSAADQVIKIQVPTDDQNDPSKYPELRDWKKFKQIENLLISCQAILGCAKGLPQHKYLYLAERLIDAAINNESYQIAIDIIEQNVLVMPDEQLNGLKRAGYEFQVIHLRLIKEIGVIYDDPNRSINLNKVAEVRSDFNDLMGESTEIPLNLCFAIYNQLVNAIYSTEQDPQYPETRKLILEAMQVTEELETPFVIPYWQTLSDISLQHRDIMTALKYAERSLLCFPQKLADTELNDFMSGLDLYSILSRKLIANIDPELNSKDALTVAARMLDLTSKIISAIAEVDRDILDFRAINVLSAKLYIFDYIDVPVDLDTLCGELEKIDFDDVSNIGVAFTGLVVATHKFRLLTRCTSALVDIEGKEQVSLNFLNNLVNKWGLSPHFDHSYYRESSPDQIADELRTDLNTAIEVISGTTLDYLEKSLKVLATNRVYEDPQMIAQLKIKIYNLMLQVYDAIKSEKDVERLKEQLGRSVIRYNRKYGGGGSDDDFSSAVN